LKTDGSGTFTWAHSIDAYPFSVQTYDGSVYVTGYFSDTVDFDPGPGTYNLTSAGLTDVFFLKLSVQGSMTLAIRVGGPLGDMSSALCISDAGSLYATGHFYGIVDFDPGPGTYNLVATGSLDDIFVMRLDTAGSFGWAVSLGGTAGDFGRAIATDPSQNVYSGGQFQGTGDFDPGPGAYNLSSTGSNDGYIHAMGSMPPGLSVSNDTTLCDGDSTQLYASGWGTFLWEPGGSLSDSTATNPLASPIITTTYTVTMTDPNGCQFNSLCG
jgi:hypothetical protein